MPVVKKRGALFAVYHDSPDKNPPTSASASGVAGKQQSHTQKKDVLSGRSPTTRSKSKAVSGGKAGMSSVKPSQAAAAASAALQSYTGTGPSAVQRKTLGQLFAHSGNALVGRKAGGGLKDKENLRALGMGIEVGKAAGKIQVLADDGMEGVPVKPLENRLRIRRALGDKSRSDVQPLSSHPSSRLERAPLATSAFTVFADPAPGDSNGQENVPPHGADPENNPSPALRRSTRKTTSASAAHTRPTSSSAQHDSGIEDPESPYISKPRLRKLKPTPMERMHTVETPRTSTIASLSQLQQPASLVLASSQPQSDVPETLDSSPLIARPQTRKTLSSAAAATTTSSKHRPTRHPISAYSVQPDPVLCDVSEAYGADTSAQPVDFGRGGFGSARGASRKVAVRRDGQGDGEGKRTGLRASTYGWTQISAGEYQAPRPPAPRTGRQSRTKW